MKKRMNFIGVFVLSIMLFSLLSCESKEEKDRERVETALELAGDNKSELEKVLEHYQQPKDSLKLEAAKFLITNMAHHSYMEIDHRFDVIFKRISRVKDHPENPRFRRDHFKWKLHKHKNWLKERDSVFSSRRIKDIESLDSGFIINNIELAFKAWYRVPNGKRASFEDFCNYILPYRSSNEPLEKDSRLNLFKKYAWVYDEINNGVTLKSIIEKVTSSFKYMVLVDISKNYRVPLSISQMEKSRIGLCDDGVNYYVNLFRALGLVASKDYVSHWGNHHSKGHSWVYMKLGTEEYAHDFRGENMFDKYKGESIPKVNRLSFEYQNNSRFSPLSTNVTSRYVKTIDVDVFNEFDIDVELPVLCVFDKNKEWELVTSGTYSWGKSRFLNMGTHVMYLSASIGIDGRLVPTNYPFYIDYSNEIHYFKPEASVVKSANILRKYGLSSPKGTKKVEWMKDLNGAEIQASNSRDFKDYKILHEIENLSSTQIQKIEINNTHKYKYIRFKSNNKKESFLAKLSFYDDKMNKLINKATDKNIFSENVTIGNKKKKIQGALDHVSLNYSGGTDFTIGVELKEPTQIGMIDFQARNDDNHIRINDDYELFYWDKEWKSLGERKAKDTVLYYDVPENALFWLRNHTRGKEEHVFAINKNKKQQWLGFDNEF